jgi:hypothetical protein
MGCFILKPVPEQSTPPPARPPRDVRLDALRGLFLIIMAGVHVPIHLFHKFQDPLGCAGAAEGFIFLSACLTGLIYGRIHARTDGPTMCGRIRKRVQRIYGVHLLALLPTVLVVWVIARWVPPLAIHFTEFLARPWGSLALMPLLLHQPPLYDILPLYVIFLGLTPGLLLLARRSGWLPLLGVSGLSWLAVQAKLDAQIPGHFLNWLPVRWGAFDLFAWQLIWVAGVALGETATRRAILPRRWRPLLMVMASAIILPGLIMRHGFWPPQWWNDDYFLWMDKWTLGPLRLLDFAAWTLLLVAWNPHPSARWLAPLAVLGRHSLAVFALHLPLVITATVVLQMTDLAVGWQNALGLVVFGIMFLWAAWLDSIGKRQPAKAVAKKNNFFQLHAGLRLAGVEWQHDKQECCHGPPVPDELRRGAGTAPRHLDPVGDRPRFPHSYRCTYRIKWCGRRVRGNQKPQSTSHIMKTKLLILALALGASTYIVNAQDGPLPGDGQQPPAANSQSGGPNGPRGGFHLLPPQARQQLKLTADQQKQLTALEADTKAKLAKILTADQMKQLDKMRPPRPQMGQGGQGGGFNRGQGGPGGDQGGPNDRQGGPGGPGGPGGGPDNGPGNGPGDSGNGPGGPGGPGGQN